VLQGFSTGLLDADIYGPSIPTLFSWNNEHPKFVEDNGKNRIQPLIKFGIKVMSIGFFIDPKQAIYILH